VAELAPVAAGRDRLYAAPMQTFESLLVERSENVVVLTINRPEKLNSLNRALIRELTAAVRSLAETGALPRCAILTGAGDKAFVAGADIAEMSTMSVHEAKTFADAGHALCAAIEQAPFPFIAAVNGFALGGGCELALSCDFIYAVERAKFGQPEVNLGLMPGFGGTQRLLRRVGAGLARELVYTGEAISADRALSIGLVNEVVPKESLLERARETAAKIATRAPLAVSACKRVMLRGSDADLAAANELEATAFSGLFGTADQREGTRAFLEKTKPSFTGR
jgi:enoyl-CoA hydratase